MDELRHNDRVLVLGSTGSGKSELINHLVGLFVGGPRVVLLDTKPEFEIAGVEPVGSIAQVDWRQPIVHLQAAAPQVSEVSEWFDVLSGMRRTMVAVHELSDLCEYSAARTPAAVNAYLSKGRAFGLGMIGGSQRPVNVPPRILSDADHVMVMATGFTRRADQESMADALGLERRDAIERLAEIQRQLGPHAYLHFSRRDRGYVVHHPLSESERRAIMVGRSVHY